jgi:sensor histidine kinase YesM
LKSTFAWLLAAAVSGMAYFQVDRLDLKILAVLVPFILWAAVLRGQIRKLELQLETQQAELELTRAELRRLQSRQAALADAPSDFHAQEAELAQPV